MYFSKSTKGLAEAATVAGSTLLTPKNALKTLAAGHEKSSGDEVEFLSEYLTAYSFTTSVLGATDAIDAAISSGSVLAKQGAKYAAGAFATSVWYTANYGAFSGLAAMAPAFLGFGPPGWLLGGVSAAATTLVGAGVDVIRRDRARVREIAFNKVALDTCWELAQIDGDVSAEEQRLLVDIMRSIRRGGDYEPGAYLVDAMDASGPRGRRTLRSTNLAESERADLYALWIGMVHSDGKYCGEERDAIQLFLKEMGGDFAVELKRIADAEDTMRRGQHFAKLKLECMHLLSRLMVGEQREAAHELLDMALISSFPARNERQAAYSEIQATDVQEIKRERLNKVADDFEQTGLFGQYVLRRDPDIEALNAAANAIMLEAANFLATLFGPDREPTGALRTRFQELSDLLGATESFEWFWKKSRKRVNEVDEYRAKLARSSKAECPNCGAENGQLAVRNVVTRNRYRCPECSTEYFLCRLSVFGCQGTVSVERRLHGELCADHQLR